jgi:hypothetical protein
MVVAALFAATSIFAGHSRNVPERINRMSIEVNDILRVALRWLVDGTDEQVNVHTFKVTDLGTTADDLEFLEALALMLDTELYAEVTDHIADNVVADILGAFNLTKNEPYAPVIWAADGVNSAADNNAWQLTELIYLNGSTPRRQGRVYLPVMPISVMNDDGNFDPALLDDLLAFTTALLSAITDGNINVRRVISNAAGTSVITPTSGGFPVAPRTQRRRTKGRGS